VAEYRPNSRSIVYRVDPVAMKAFRARAAARYLAQRIADARLSAIRRSASHGLRFEPASPDYRVSLVADGNGNGLRTAEIQRGIDRPAC